MGEVSGRVFQSPIVFRGIEVVLAVSLGFENFDKCLCCGAYFFAASFEKGDYAFGLWRIEAAVHHA